MPAGVGHGTASPPAGQETAPAQSGAVSALADELLDTVAETLVLVDRLHTLLRVITSGRSSVDARPAPAVTSFPNPNTP